MEELFDHVRHFQETQRVEFKSFQHLLSDVADQLTTLQRTLEAELAVCQTSHNAAPVDDASKLLKNDGFKQNAHGDVTVLKTDLETRVQQKKRFFVVPSGSAPGCRVRWDNLPHCAMSALQVNALPTELRSRVTRLTRCAGVCLSFFRSKSSVEEKALESDEPDSLKYNESFIPEYLFETCAPEPLIILEAIARHFLHINRSDLWQTLSQEVADARVAFPPTYKSQLESYPWVYPASERVEKRQDFRVEPEVHENDQVAVDLSTSTTQDAMVDTPKTPTNVKFSCAPSPTAKENNLGQNGFSEVCPLVLPGIVVAYHELHTILNALRNGNITPAVNWFKSQSNSRQMKHIGFAFALYEVQFFKLLISLPKKMDSLDVALSLLLYIREKFGFFFAPLQSEVLRLLGFLALSGDVLQTIAQHQKLRNETSTAMEDDDTSPLNRSLLELFAFDGKKNRRFLSPLYALVCELLECPQDALPIETFFTAAQETALSSFLSMAYQQLCTEFKRVFSNLGTTVTIPLQRPEVLPTTRDAAEAFSNANGVIMEIDEVGFKNQKPKLVDESKTIVKLPRESPLAVAVAAGMACLPQVYGLVASLHHGGSALEQIKSWISTNKLPLDIDLISCFHFHTQYTCPICRSPGGDSEESAAAEFKPCRLPCGHIICRSCLDRITIRTRRNTVKCPTCPHQAVVASVQELVFDWMGHEQQRKVCLL